MQMPWLSSGSATGIALLTPLLSRPSREARAGAEAAELRAGTGPGEGGTFGSHLAQVLLHRAGSKGQQENRARMDPALRTPWHRKPPSQWSKGRKKATQRVGQGARPKHWEQHSRNTRNGMAKTSGMAQPEHREWHGPALPPGSPRQGQFVIAAPHDLLIQSFSMCKSTFSRRELGQLSSPRLHHTVLGQGLHFQEPPFLGTGLGPQ